jgi:hypothetical protein
MAFVTGHDGGDNLPVQGSHQKQFRPNSQLSLDVLVRVVPRPDEIAAFPKGDDCFFVLWVKSSDLHKVI